MDNLVRRLGRRYDWMITLSRRARRPFRVLAASIGALVTVHQLTWPAWGATLARLTLIFTVLAGGWFLTSLLFVVEQSTLPRLRVDVTDNLRARSYRTQLILLRRVTAVAVAVFVFIIILLSFEEVRKYSGSIVASAGVVAAVATFASNALLSNLVAGLQIAFSGSLRLQDVVVVEREWGRVEAITLTYVILHIWDDRRLVLPTSYFTNRPFENWTRTQAPLIGDVYVAADWTVNIGLLREQLRDMLNVQEMWDRRVGIIQLVDADGGHLRLRALVSARDAPTLWDLRCLTREHLARCVAAQHASPRARAELDKEQPPQPIWTETFHPHRRRGDRFFSGDPESADRGASFRGPGGDRVPAPSGDGHGDHAGDGHGGHGGDGGAR